MAATIIFLGLASLASSAPIMVSFGTSGGPILPPGPLLHPPAAPRSLEARLPAPVSEASEDVPDVHPYRPPIPHQYRTKLYAQRPLPNLILGTPIDQEYTPAVKYAASRKQDLAEGVDYTGPQVFERQAYELFEVKRVNPLKYGKPHYWGKSAKTVPQIGVVYSSGVRFYVPQLVYGEEQENSVYNHPEEEYYRVKNQ